MKTAIIIISILASSLLNANTLDTEKSLREFSDKMLNHIMKTEVQKGFDMARPHWPIPEVEVDSIVNQLSKQQPVIKQRFGKAIEIEFIKKKQIGKSFVRLYYLHKYERHAMYWQIDFYKPHDTWLINKIITLDELDVLYE